MIAWQNNKLVVWWHSGAIQMVWSTREALYVVPHPTWRFSVKNMTGSEGALKRSKLKAISHAFRRPRNISIFWIRLWQLKFSYVTMYHFFDKAVSLEQNVTANFVLIFQMHHISGFSFSCRCIFLHWIIILHLTKGPQSSYFSVPVFGEAISLTATRRK